jgi:predicted nucleic acid-binding protein
MTVLIDANVMLRMIETESPRRTEAIQATQRLRRSETLVSVPQVAYEFWAVATRSLTNNGLGMAVDEADEALRDMLELFPVLQDERGILRRWWDLVRQYGVKGVKSFDARLVAAMQRHNIVHILTFNDGDVTRYNGIVVLTPELVLAGNS